MLSDDLISLYYPCNSEEITIAGRINDAMELNEDALDYMKNMAIINSCTSLLEKLVKIGKEALQRHEEAYMVAMEAL